MKKVLATILGLTMFSSLYAESYTMYAKPSEKSDKIGNIDDQSPQYQVIFSKNNWVEIVNKKDGQVGWIKQKEVNNNSQKKQKDPIEQMMMKFQQRQQMLDQHFNRMIADIDKNIGQTQVASGNSIKNQPRVYKKFSSVTINSDGKTAKIVKKTEDGDGNTQTVEKEIPADQLNNLKIEN